MSYHTPTEHDGRTVLFAAAELLVYMVVQMVRGSYRPML